MHGHSLGLRQDIRNMVKFLPRVASECDTLVIRKKTKAGQKPHYTTRKIVEQLMRVFERHNPGYQELMENPNQFNRKTERMAPLPEHGQLQGLLVRVVDILPIKNKGPNDQDDPTPSCSQYPLPVDQKDDIQCFKIYMNKGEATRDWPRQEEKGVSEFKEPFLFSKLYPTLFPDGVGDPRMDGRRYNPSLDKYTRYWMEYGEEQ